MLNRRSLISLPLALAFTPSFAQPRRIGRAETADDRIAKLQARIAGMDGWVRKGGYGVAVPGRPAVAKFTIRAV